MSDKRQSLTTQLLIRLFCIAFIVALATETFVLERSYSALRKSLNAAILARAESIAMLTTLRPDGSIEIDFADEVMEDFSGRHPEAYFLVLGVADGFEVERSRSLEKRRLRLPEPLERISRRRPAFWNTRIGEDKVRFVALREAVRPAESAPRSGKSGTGCRTEPNRKD